jgi:hypothetical protein
MSLERSNMIDVYTLARLNRYTGDDRGYSPRRYAVDDLFAMHRYQSTFDREKEVLSQALSELEVKAVSLADQVFGNQARQQKLQVMHDGSLIVARYELHKRHIRDIQHRLSELQGEISVQRMLNPTMPPKDLEKLLVNLEAEKRDEETAFWKDTVKLRQEMFTGVREYQAMKHRTDILKSLEVEDA